MGAIHRAGKPGRPRGRARPTSPPRSPRAAASCCLGLNYSEHALEGGRAVPTWPDAFVARRRQACSDPYADLVKPALTSRFDYEGRARDRASGAGGRYIRAEDALDAIAGFVVLNDASCRDWQRAAHPVDGRQELRGQHADRPRGGDRHDEVDVSDLAISSTLNGTASVAVGAHLADARQRPGRRGVLSPRSPTWPREMSSPPARRAVLASPGRQPVWMEPGDLIEVTVREVGAIRNRIVAEQGAPADWRWRPADKPVTRF